MKVGLFGLLTPDKFNQFSIISIIELVLEIIYTLGVPMFVRKYTDYKFFYPTISGVDLLLKNFVIFCIVVMILFPLTLNNMLNRPMD